MTSDEIWRPVVGFEDHYEVSDQGRVKSLARLCNSKRGSLRRVAERILTPVPVRTRRDGKSRFVVSLHKDGVHRYARIPHLVLEAFEGPRLPGQETRHLNCDPSDNRRINLRWGTPKENHADTLRLDHILRGEQHAGAKLTRIQVLKIRDLRATGISGVAIAAQFGVSTQLVYRVALKRGWQHV